MEVQICCMDMMMQLNKGNYKIYNGAFLEIYHKDEDWHYKGIGLDYCPFCGSNPIIVVKK